MKQHFNLLEKRGSEPLHQRLFGQMLLVRGDLVHVAPIQFPNPAVTVTYDGDRSADAERTAAFARAARTSR